jgi:hypothetical protein
MIHFITTIPLPWPHISDIESIEVKWAGIRRHKRDEKKNLRGFSPQANYTDRAIVAGQRS